MKRYISFVVMLIVASTFVIGTSVADDSARGDDQGAVRALAKKATGAVSKVVKRDRDRKPVQNTVEKVSDAIKAVGDSEPVRSVADKLENIAKRDGDRQPVKKLAGALKDALKRDGGKDK